MIVNGVRQKSVEGDQVIPCVTRNGRSVKKHLFLIPNWRNSQTSFLKIANHHRLANRFGWLLVVPSVSIDLCDPEF